MNAKRSEVYVGIDVSKAQLDVAIGKDGEYWQAGNDRVGIDKCVARLRAIQPALIVIESSGGLEMPLMTELYAAELPFARVHPARVRDFARSLGLLAKTDKLDARLLAHFGQAVQPPVTQLPGEAEQSMNALLLRRRQLLDMLVDEKNHLASTRLSLRPRVEEHIQWLEREIADFEKQVDEQIQHIPAFQEKSAVLRSAKGVGPILCAKLLSGLPELGKLNRKKIAALVGVAPYNDDSGRRRGKRKTQGGREDVREVLYMGTVAAVRSNSVIKAFYQHLLKQGKLKKVALVACMRKFLTILNAMVRDMQPWNSGFPATAS
jgi:transposase